MTPAAQLTVDGGRPTSSLLSHVAVDGCGPAARIGLYARDPPLLHAPGVGDERLPSPQLPFQTEEPWQLLPVGTSLFFF